MFKFLRNIIKGDRQKIFCSAIIVAAGKGSRMNTEKGKLFMEIDDYPVLYYTLCALEESKRIDEIILVVREEDILYVMDLSKEYGFEKVTKIIKGGDERVDSAMNGLKEVNKNTNLIAIHDGARPFVLPDHIDETIKTAFETKAAALGVKVKDTIKIVDENMEITSTPDRKNIWAIQTPQVFHKNILENAYREYLSNKEDFGDITDDCMLVEKIGYKIKMVEGSYENIKITTPEDIYIGEAILKYRDTEG